VRQGGVQFRVPVQHAAQDQMRAGNGSIKRVAKQIAQLEMPQSRAADCLLRMQKDGQFVLFYPLENGFKQWVIEIPVVDVRSHLDSPDTW
jgi:hypothetical protein